MLEEILAKLSEEEKAIILEAIAEAGKGKEGAEEEVKAEDPEKPEEEKAEDPKDEEDKEDDEENKRLAEEVQKRESAEKRIAKLEERIELDAAEKRCAIEFNAIPTLSNRELATVLKSAKGSLEAKTYQKLEGALKSCNEVILKSDLFRESGSSASGNIGNPQSKINALAEKRAQDTGESKTVAYQNVLKANRDLFEATEGDK